MVQVVISQTSITPASQQDPPPSGPVVILRAVAAASWTKATGIPVVPESGYSPCVLWHYNMTGPQQPY